MTSSIAPKAAPLLALALVVAGCTSERDPVPPACSQGSPAIMRALERAPAPVTLAGATRLSTCISRSRTDSELQPLGSTLLAVADELRARSARDDDAAVSLGYLVGATRRGVAGNPGLATQLGRRLEQTARLEGASPARRAALRRGLRAGEDSG